MIKEAAIGIFRQHKQLHMSEALAYGISRYMLYSLRDEGIIEQLTRGVYRLAALPSVSDPDLVTVSLRYPKGVICLISALFFHDITTQIPRRIHIAIPRSSRFPSLLYPPLEVYKFSKLSFTEGVEEHAIDGVNVKIYTREKTLADCFKYRNKIGMDVVLEALKLYRRQGKFNINEILRYAKICRVEKIVMPYLEVII